MHIIGIFNNKSENSIAPMVQGFLDTKKIKLNIMGRKAFLGMDTASLKAYLKELSDNNTDLLVLNLSPDDSLQNIFDWLKLDLVLYCSGNEYDTNDPLIMTRLFDITDSKGILVFNDDYRYPMVDENTNSIVNKQILTYGFGDSAVISASSTGEDISNDGCLLSLQKTITTLHGYITEPQEYRLNVESYNLTGNDLLAGAAFIIAYGC